MPRAASPRGDTGSSQAEPALRAWRALLGRGQAAPVAPGARGTPELGRVPGARWAVVTNWARAGRFLLPPSSCENTKRN